MPKSDREIFEYYIKHSRMPEKEKEEADIFYEYMEKDFSEKECLKENQKNKKEKIIYSTEKKKQNEDEQYKAFKSYIEKTSVCFKEESPKVSGQRAKKRSKDVRPKNSLDLHGYTQNEALVRIRKFVSKCVLAKESPVIIIHGKGYHSENGKSVLADIVEYYVRVEGDESVISMENAPRNLGGSGAKILCLKLKK